MCGIAGVVGLAADGAIWCCTQYATTVRQVIDVFERWTGVFRTVKVGSRQAFDCGALPFDPFQAAQFDAAVRGVVPAWVWIRDAAYALLGGDPALSWRR